MEASHSRKKNTEQKKNTSLDFILHIQLTYWLHLLNICCCLEGHAKSIIEPVLLLKLMVSGILTSTLKVNWLLFASHILKGSR